MIVKASVMIVLAAFLCAGIAPAQVNEWSDIPYIEGNYSRIYFDYIQGGKPGIPGTFCVINDWIVNQDDFNVNGGLNPDEHNLFTFKLGLTDYEIRVYGDGSASVFPNNLKNFTSSFSWTTSPNEAAILHTIWEFSFEVAPTIIKKYRACDPPGGIVTVYQNPPTPSIVTGGPSAYPHFADGYFADAFTTPTPAPVPARSYQSPVFDLHLPYYDLALHLGGGFTATPWEPYEPGWDDDERRTYIGDSLVEFARSVTADGTGGVHAIWFDDRDGNDEIYYKRSLDGGETWGSDVRLTNDPADSRNPSIWADASGNLHIIWNDDRDGNWEIYYARSLDSGTTWSGDVRLTNDAANSRNADICSDLFGNLHVAWNDSRDGNDQIYYKRSTDGGTTWESDLRLINSTAASRYPSICTDSLDRVHVTWHDSRDGNVEIYYKRSTDSGITWETDVRLTNQSGNSDFSSVCADPPGNVHVVWHDSRNSADEIYYKCSLDGGATWEADVQLTSGGDCAYPSICTDSVYSLHVVWQDEDYTTNREIYYKRSTDGGATWEFDMRLTFDSAYSEHPSVCTDVLDNIHIVWQDDRHGNYEIYTIRGNQPKPSELYLDFDLETPIVPRLGVVKYDALMASTYSTSQTFLFGTLVYLPGGIPLPGFIDGPMALTLNPDGFGSLPISHTIPPFAPVGEYMLRGHLAYYPPARIQETDVFYFTVTP